MSKKKKPVARSLADEIINDLYHQLVAVSEKIEAADPKELATFRALLSLLLALGVGRLQLAKALDANAAVVYNWTKYGVPPRTTYIPRYVGDMKKLLDAMLTEMRTTAYVEKEYLGAPWRRKVKGNKAYEQQARREARRQSGDKGDA